MNSNTHSEDKNISNKKKNPDNKVSQWSFPDIYLILGAFMVFMAMMSWVVNAGQYERMVMPNGRLSVVADTYQVIKQTPVGIMQVITAVHDGLVGASQIVFLLLLVGGSVGVVRRTGAIDYGLNKLLKKFGHKPSLILALLTIIFGLISAFTGQVELGIAYVPIVMPLALSLGYDSITAAGLALLGPTLGFAFGITAPATIATGHMIAELPMFSGAYFRAIAFAVIMVISTAYLIWYAEWVRKTPERAYNRDVDLKLKEEYSRNGGSFKDVQFTRRQALAAGISAILFCIVVAAILIYSLRFNAIAGLFVVWAIVTSAIAGDTPNRICANFNAGCREMLVGSIVVGVARSITVVMEAGNILDTLVYNLANLIGALPGSITAVGILLSQATFNFLVPSGSGQLLATLPVLIPLGDLLEINRQVIVLASHWGDGISNIFFPTSGYFVAILAIARVSYVRWIKFYTPLFAIVVLFAVVGVIVAQTIKLGPF